MKKPRYPPQPRIDGLSGEEGTFNMRPFWLVEALTRAGLADAEKLDQAGLLFERVLGLCVKPLRPFSRRCAGRIGKLLFRQRCRR
jgi:hypothetical protein